MKGHDILFAKQRYWFKPHGALLGLAALLLTLAALLSTGTVGAQGGEDTPETPVEPADLTFHPAIVLLDADGVSVLDSGNPVSTMQTCVSCHDTEFIARHSFHSDVGLSTLTTPGEAASGLPWDFGDGIFGEWNPILYRYLSADGDTHIDLTTAEWVQVFGARHAGGGPALYGRDGELLTDLDADEITVETGVLDADGELAAWDWAESGVVEMNCFLCHLPEPNNDARIAALQAGNFQWANTATLASTDAVTQTDDAWAWNADAFDTDGAWLAAERLIQNPTNTNCGTCHGLVHAEAQTPLVLESCAPTQWSTITSGQIYSPQRLSDTGVNLSNKDDLGRSYDIHAERVLNCTDCHYALNNPVYYREDEASQPDHLLFDTRRIDLREYLYRPLHEFAKGSSAQGNLAAEVDNSIRRCEMCHEPVPNHEWLPFLDRHMDSLSCETCHVPKLYSPARQYNDWTVLQATGQPFTACRGLDAESGTYDTFGTTLITGFEPALLPRADKDGSTSLAPYNLVTSWYWVYGDPARPVPYRDLQAVWLDGGDYRAEVLGVFDANDDGMLDADELFIDTDAKETFIAGELAAVGLDDPRIMADVRPYTISHN
ncbi:MAG: hypothetical protein K8S97_03050, partial [Anaerolineae bacterium]|nr:hypothetical protein [Anaerolineae bacterium]